MEMIGEGLMFILIFIGSILVNIPVLIVYSQSNTIRSVTDKFLLNVVIADVLSLALLFPTILTLLVTGWEVGPGWKCGLSNGLLAGLATASVIAAFQIAVERYLAVVTPLHYHKLLTGPTILLSSVLGGLLSIGSAVIASLDPTTFSIFPGCNPPPPKGKPPHHDQEGYNPFPWMMNKEEGNGDEILWATINLIYLILTFVLPLILMTFIYTRIWIEARRQHVRMRKRIQPYFVPVPLDHHKSSLDVKSTKEEGLFPFLTRFRLVDRLRATRIDRAARVAICTIGVTLISWTPYYYVRAASATHTLWMEFQDPKEEYYNNNNNNNSDDDVDWDYGYVPLLCGSLHPLIAPIFYAYRYKRLRTEVFRLLSQYNSSTPFWWSKSQNGTDTRSRPTSSSLSQRSHQTPDNTSHSILINDPTLSSYAYHQRDHDDNLLITSNPSYKGDEDNHNLADDPFPYRDTLERGGGGGGGGSGRGPPPPKMLVEVHSSSSPTTDPPQPDLLLSSPHILLEQKSVEERGRDWPGSWGDDDGDGSVVLDILDHNNNNNNKGLFHSVTLLWLINSRRRWFGHRESVSSNASFLTLISNKYDEDNPLYTL